MHGGQGWVCASAAAAAAGPTSPADAAAGPTSTADAEAASTAGADATSTPTGTFAPATVRPGPGTATGRLLGASCTKLDARGEAE